MNFSAPLLSIENLRTSFKSEIGWRPVVDGVSFDIAQGETVAIVGESGSGKSVTALSIMQLLEPGSTRIEGSIRFNGDELLTKSDNDLRRIRGNEIAMIFQEPMTSLNPVITIGQQLTETLLAHKPVSVREARTEAIALLDKVHIPSAARRIDDYPHQFSGGMRQRVMIAMALSCSPGLLIADEPTTALDVTIQSQILDLLKSMQQENGMSVLFITHDMGVVAEISDKTVVMYRSKVVEQGLTRNILEEPKHSYSRSLLLSVPILGSMNGTDRPARFPTVDPNSGLVIAPEPVSQTPRYDRPPILDVRNMSTRFAIRSGVFGKLTGQVHAVDDVSLRLHEGETLSIVGESGCGKSTTGRSILRLVEPTAGSIEVEGEQIVGRSRAILAEARRRMQMIFQDPFASLNPRIRVGDSIAEPLIARGIGNSKEREARVNDLLAKVGLTAGMGTRYPHEFSGGQRQRICIARALALNPKIIVADECVSALDVSVKAQVLNLMIDLQQELGLSYLFISHDIAVVERMSHRVAVMYLGKIVEFGSRASVLENPQHPYTKRLLSAVPTLDADRRSRLRGIDVEELRSPVHPKNYVSPANTYQTVAEGHFVLSNAQ